MPTQLNQLIEVEINRLHETYGYDAQILNDFALFVKNNAKRQRSKYSKLNRDELKNAVYSHFAVSDTKALRQSSKFKLASSGLGKLNLSKTDSWEKLYRKFIGILPGEDQEKGYGKVNGIDIFKYDLPWRIFSLDPQKASNNDIKVAYRKLSKIYHPDNPSTGDKKIFERINQFYKSMIQKF